jgi:hypothetical protein
VRQTGLVNLAGWVVALVQNDGLVCLRHPQAVPVLVQCVNLTLQAIGFIVCGSPSLTLFELSAAFQMWRRGAHSI